jgi:hypothetical protein
VFGQIGRNGRNGDLIFFSVFICMFFNVLEIKVKKSLRLLWQIGFVFLSLCLS